MIKDEAQADYYGLDRVFVDGFLYDSATMYNGTEKICRTMKEAADFTRWEQFRGDVEPDTEDRLRQDLISTCGSKAGHCLNGMLPIVNVDLIQKLAWGEAKPRCY